MFDSNCILTIGIDASIRSAAEQQLSQAAEADFVSLYSFRSLISSPLSSVLTSFIFTAWLPYHTI